MPSITVDSPLGPLVITETDGALSELGWGRAEREEETALLGRAAQQLNAYFYCELKFFDLPVAPVGSAFQQSVWRLMQDIPYGETRTYGAFASALGNAARAVGGACGKNPIPIIIPCHRVVAAHESLGGYSGKGGAGTKLFLLELEGWRPQGGHQPSLFEEA